MKHLHIICSLNPAEGGPPEVVRQFEHAYAALGHTMETVCLDQPGSPWLQNLLYPVHTFKRYALHGFSWSPRLPEWLRVNLGRFDASVVHGLWSSPGLALRRAALRAKVPYGVYPHGGLDPWFNRHYPFKHLKKRLFWPVQYPVLRDAAGIFFTTETERDLAATSFKPSQWNSVIVPYPMKEPGGDPAGQIAAFYSKLPQLRGRRFLLFISRIHQKKGCDLLLVAFARVAASAPDLDVVVAGPDQEHLRAKLQEIAADKGIAGRVHWPGMLSGDVKWGALRAADAFVLPSHQENFGVVVVESLAAGRPVLISNQVNVWPEIQADGVGLVDDDTVDGTERLLAQWIALPSTNRDAMASRARSTFVHRYSKTNPAQAIISLFTNLHDKENSAQSSPSLPLAG